MTLEARLPSKPKRKSPRRALELRAIIKELAPIHTPIQIAKIVGKTKQIVYTHLKNLLEDGELDSSQTTYVRAGPIEERKWYKIIKITGEELSFYAAEGLVPTLRKMYYRLIELGVMEKCKGNYDRFARTSAEARRGVDSTFTKITSLPRLPIDCFRDEKRETIGYSDIHSYPRQPTPAEPPEDPEEYIEERIQWLRDAPNDYDGRCKGGSKGANPGKWWMQPVYCEIWCESETIQPDLLKFQNDVKVRVAASGGFISTPYMYENCKWLKQITDSYDHIQKIVIVYFGDKDDAGDDISNNIENGLQFYRNSLGIRVDIEFRRTAVTPEQAKKYDLIRDPDKNSKVQLEAFLTTKKRLEIFKKIAKDAIRECWNEEIWLDNCPPEEYDYKAHNVEKPEDIDPDNTFWNDTEETVTDMMYRKIDEAFQAGWNKS